MTKKRILLIITASCLLGAYILGNSHKIKQKIVNLNEKINPTIVLENNIPDKPKEEVKETPPKPQKTVTAKIIKLEKEFTLSLNGPVTGVSIAKLQSDLNKIAAENTNNKDVYLVIHSPGGSVVAGQRFIDYAKAMPFKVHTITIFGASMGFQIAQGLNDRLVTPGGILMSHPAFVSGLTGEVGGSLDTNYEFINKLAKSLDLTASLRMGLSLKDYQDLVRHEYWTFGNFAIEEKSADKMVFARCGDSLIGSVEEIVPTFFGDYSVTLDKCPLITEPTDIRAVNCEADNCKKAEEFLGDFQSIYNQPKDFFDKYIKNGKFMEILK